MKRPLLIIGGVLLLLVGAYFFSARQASGNSLIGPDVNLVLFATGATQKGILSVPFTEATDSSVRATVTLGDTVISDGISIKSRAGERVGIPVTVASAPQLGEVVTITLALPKGSQKFSRPISEIATESTDLMELQKATKPELSMKGIFADIVYAQVTEAARIVPDISQAVGECAPTAAADSLASLAQEHGVAAKLPESAAMISELKTEMRWSAANGVLPDDFVRGKDRWAAKHSLPIKTKIVGTGKGVGTLQGILDGMAQGGGAAELRLSITDAGGKTLGGHLVSVSAVRVEGDATFIEVSDPRTPEGTDTYEVSGDTVLGYPVEGAAHLSFGFVQIWEGTQTAKPMPELSPTEVQGIQKAAGIKPKIKILTIGSHEVPYAQFRVSTGAGCDAAHYRAVNGSVLAIDGTRLKDPGGCGYGRVREIRVAEVDAP